MTEERTAAKKRLLLFIVLTIGITWLVFLLIPISGQAYGSGLSLIILTVAMFIPALGNVLTRLITKEGFGNMYLHPHFKGNIRLYLLVFFGPTVLLLVSGVVYFLIFPGNFDVDLTVLKASAPAGFSAGALLAIQILQVAVIGPVINIIPTMGEELGWRGYLLPKLRLLLSDRAALAVTGAIWGLWHLPVIVMGHNYGTDYVGYPWLGILAMIVFCIVLGVIEGYFTIRMESAIPAAMIHSTVNAGAALPIVLAKSGYNPLLGPAITGLVGGLPFILVAILLLVKVGKKGPAKGIETEQ